MRWFKLPRDRVSFLRRAFGAAGAALAVLGAARPLSAAGDQVGGYQIVRLSRGHYNRLYLPLSIDGTKGTMMVSTASIHTVVNREKFPSLVSHKGQNLPPGVSPTVDVYERNLPVSVTQDLRLGSVGLGQVPVALEPGFRLYDRQMIYQGGSDRQYDGILCADLLRRYHAIIDCGREAMYVNTGTAQRMHLGDAFAKAGWTRVPMIDFGKRFAVPCIVNGHRFRIVVSTNSPYTLLDSDQLELAKISASEPSKNSTLLTPRNIRARALLYGNFQVGDYLAVDTQSFAYKGLKSEADRTIEREERLPTGEPIVGYLGGNFLAHNGAIIDLEDQALYLKRMSAEVY